MEELIRALESPVESERLYAVQDICETGNPEMVEVLIGRLAGEKSPAVREAIVFCLKNVDCGDRYPLLFKLFASADAYLRNAAVGIFGSKGEDAVAFLTAHLDHADREIRKLVLDALFATGTREALMAIRAGLHDPSVNVRITAVEYLGQLADRESVTDLVRLLQDSDEPMLRTAILESLPLMAGADDIRMVLEILIPHGDFTGLPPLYIPEVIRLVAEAGDLETFCRVIDAIGDCRAYADDVVSGICQARRRFPSIMGKKRILPKVLTIVRDSRNGESVRNGACELVLDDGILNADTMEGLGLELVEEEEMRMAGIRLLAGSGKETARNRIIGIRTETKDDRIRRFCDQVMAAGAEIE